MWCMSLLRRHHDIGPPSCVPGGCAPLPLSAATQTTHPSNQKRLRRPLCPSAAPCNHGQSTVNASNGEDGAPFAICKHEGMAGQARQLKASKAPLATGVRQQLQPPGCRCHWTAPQLAAAAPHLLAALWVLVPALLRLGSSAGLGLRHIAVGVDQVHEGLVPAPAAAAVLASRAGAGAVGGLRGGREGREGGGGGA